MRTEKVLLDTDIGGDLGDAVCLAYLLARKDCELMGVTTVNGDTLSRAQLASAILMAAGSQAPVYPGAKDTLLARRARKPVPQAEALTRLKHRDRFEENMYLEFMRDVILDNPGEVTLLATGPLTNAALLFAAYPDTARELKRLVIAGGGFQNSPPAHTFSGSNLMCDPHASEIVYRARVREHWSVGRDGAAGLSIGRDEVYARFRRHPVLCAVLPMADAFFQGSVSRVQLCALSAAALIFGDSLAAWESGLVEIELHADAFLGAAAVKRADYLEERHRIAVSIDEKAILDDFALVFGL